MRFMIPAADPWIGKFTTSFSLPPSVKSRRRPVTELDLSVRAQNCLESEDIQTVRDLIVKAEAELLAVRNLGKTSLQDIKNKLAKLGLSLGMSLDALPAAEGAEPGGEGES